MKLTIKIERDDGQFTIAQTDIPDRRPEYSGQIEHKVLVGFFDAWHRCAELPR